MYLTPINFQSQVSTNYATNNINMKGKKIPYCLDTRIFDTFLKRLEALRKSPDSDIANLLKDKVGQNFGILLNTDKSSIANVEALANELELPLFKITQQDFIDKSMNKELRGGAAHYIDSVVEQLRYKYITTGEKSVLLFEDIDKMLPKGCNTYDTNEKASLILQVLHNAKDNGIIPVLTTHNTADIDSKIITPIIKRVSVV